MSYPPVTNQPIGFNVPPPQPPPYGASVPYPPMPSGSPYPPPITNQPGVYQPGYPPPPSTYMGDCPPGLQYLTQLDQILIHQKVELLEAFIGFETKNQYTVKNSMGQPIFNAKEDVDCCTRNCCGSVRPFDMKIKDHNGSEVVHLYRPLRCTSCWFPCCLQEMIVSSPPGNVIGSVKQNWSIFFPNFSIKDETGKTVLRIEGPLCTSSCLCNDVEFKVLTADGSTVIGKIVKQWSGLAREAFSDADHFGISFPMDLSVKIKAVLMGACMLIDFMFFESGNERRRNTLY